MNPVECREIGGRDGDHGEFTASLHRGGHPILKLVFKENYG